MNIFVSNLSVAATEQQLNTLFSGFGVVQSTVMIRQNPAHPFCWIVMKDQHDAEQALSHLNHSQFLLQDITVNKADLQR